MDKLPLSASNSSVCGFPSASSTSLINPMVVNLVNAATWGFTNDDDEETAEGGGGGAAERSAGRETVGASISTAHHDEGPWLASY